VPAHFPPDGFVKKDLESRRVAIARALRGRERPSARPVVDPGPAADPAGDTDVRAAVTSLTQSLSALSRRVDELSQELADARTATPARHHVPEMPAVVDEDEPVARASVPPLTAARMSEHAFDVLLGRR
jgi:hypothetical protein